jgi:hypothetical protein
VIGEEAMRSVSEKDVKAFDQYANCVRLRLSLRDIAEEACPDIERIGKTSFVCRSPFREDKDRSFRIFESGGGEWMAFDYGIKKSFDLFQFVQAWKGLSYVKTVKWCGDRIGLPWDGFRSLN